MRSSATTAIEKLVEIGVLTQIGSGRRNRRFVAPVVLDELDEYARGDDVRLTARRA